MVVIGDFPRESDARAGAQALIIAAHELLDTILSSDRKDWQLGHLRFIRAVQLEGAKLIAVWKCFDPYLAAAGRSITDAFQETYSAAPGAGDGHVMMLKDRVVEFTTSLSGWLIDSRETPKWEPCKEPSAGRSDGVRASDERGVTAPIA